MNSLHDTVAIVIVTHNRKTLLKRCLLSALSQSRMPDAIIVIDNASTDGTEEMLRQEFQGYPLLLYCNTGRNLGGAGGFHHGAKLAVEKGADWVCLMDDDCLLHPDCIQQLTKHIDDRDHIYSPLILSVEDRQTVLWGIKAKVNSGNLEVVTIPFNGFLIHRDTIAAIGYPDKDFFIYGDDADYNFRARASGRKVFLVTDSVMYHPLKNTLQELAVVKLFLNKHWVYYKLRNAIVVAHRYGYFSVKQFVMLLAALGFYLVTFNFRLTGLWVAGLKDGLKDNVYVRDFER